MGYSLRILIEAVAALFIGYAIFLLCCHLMVIISAAIGGAA